MGRCRFPGETTPCLRPCSRISHESARLAIPDRQVPAALRSRLDTLSAPHGQFPGHPGIWKWMCAGVATMQRAVTPCRDPCRPFLAFVVLPAGEPRVVAGEELVPPGSGFVAVLRNTVPMSHLIFRFETLSRKSSANLSAMSKRSDCSPRANFISDCRLIPVCRSSSWETHARIGNLPAENVGDCARLSRLFCSWHGINYYQSRPEVKWSVGVNRPCIGTREPVLWSCLAANCGVTTMR